MFYKSKLLEIKDISVENFLNLNNLFIINFRTKSNENIKENVFLKNIIRYLIKKMILLITLVRRKYNNKHLSVKCKEINISINILIKKIQNI